MRLDRGRSLHLGRLVGLSVFTILVAAIVCVQMGVVAELLETREIFHEDVFNVDGAVSYFYVERENSSLPASVELYHPENSLDLYVNTTNIDTLWIDCQSLYDSENSTVWYDPIPDYVLWFPSKPKFTVYLTTDGNLSEVFFTSASGLEPVSVTWGGLTIPYTVDGGTISGEAPEHNAGETYAVSVYYSQDAFANTAMMGVAMLVLLAGIAYSVVRIFNTNDYGGGKQWGGKLY